MKENDVKTNAGRVPPQAIDVEEAVLGAILSNKDAIHEAVEKLKPEIFYKDDHKFIFEAMINLYNDSKPIDLVTLSTELRRIDKLVKAGGDYYLIQLTQKISSSAHLDYHCAIILQKYIQRKCIEYSESIIINSYNDDFDVFELLNDVYSNFGSVNDILTVGKTMNFQEDVLNYIPNSQKNGSSIKSSFTSFNKATGGFFNSDLTIVAGRPGMGKTCYILNELLYMAFNGVNVTMFSLEMSTHQIIGRLLGIISGIESDLIRQTSKLSQDQKNFLQKCAIILSKLPITIDDTAGLSPMKMKLKLAKIKREKGLDICFVDYLQLMTIEDKKINNREREISIISSSLKSMAKEFDIPVIALSQLSRSVETRGASKRPLLSDLRDSGSIEQDADMVVFIYRPEYYKIDEWDDDERSSTRNTAELDIAKFRGGETGYVRIGCNLAFMRMYDLNADYDAIQNRYVNFERNFELPKVSLNDAFDSDDLPF